MIPFLFWEAVVLIDMLFTYLAQRRDPVLREPTGLFVKHLGLLGAVALDAVLLTALGSVLWWQEQQFAMITLSILGLVVLTYDIFKWSHAPVREVGE